MERPNLDKIIKENLDKAKFQSKKQPSLPKGGWLDGYKSGGQTLNTYAGGGQPITCPQGKALINGQCVDANPQNNYQTLPGVTVTSKAAKKPVQPTNIQTLPEVTVTSKPKKPSAISKGISSAVNTFTKSTTGFGIPNIQSNQMSQGSYTAPMRQQQFDTQPYSQQPIQQAPITQQPAKPAALSPSYSYTTIGESSPFNYGRKTTPGMGNAQASLAMMNMSKGLGQDAYTSLLETIDPDRANIQRFMSNNPFARKFYDGGYISDEARATQFGQYRMGGGMFPEYHSYAPPRMNNGGGLLSRTVTCSSCGHSWRGITGGMDPLTCHNCGGMIKMSYGGDPSIPDLDADKWLMKYQKGGGFLNRVGDFFSNIGNGIASIFKGGKGGGSCGPLGCPTNVGGTGDIGTGSGIKGLGIGKFLSGVGEGVCQGASCAPTRASFIGNTLDKSAPINKGYDVGYNLGRFAEDTANIFNPDRYDLSFGNSNVCPSGQYYDANLNRCVSGNFKDGGQWLERYQKKGQVNTFGLPNPRDLQRQMINRSDVSLSTQQKQKQDDIAEEIHRRNIATDKRQFVGQGKASTKESEARRKALNKQYMTRLPNAAYDEQTGEISRVNPDRSVTGEAENFMSRREDKAGEHALGALEAAGYLTGAGELAGAGYKTLRNALGESMESGLLSKTYKINPWAWKPNPESAYRMIGNEEGLGSALENGYLKPSTVGSDIGKIHSETHFQIGAPSDKRKYYSELWDRGYPGPYMAEVSNAVKDPRFSPTTTFWGTGKEIGDNVITHPENYIPTSEAKLYKQDWLRGYKEVPKSKVSNSIMRNPEGEIQFLDNDAYKDVLTTGKKNIINYLSDPRYGAVVEQNQQLANRLGLNQTLPIQREMGNIGLQDARVAKMNQPITIVDPRSLETKIIQGTNEGIQAQYSRNLGGSGFINIPRVFDKQTTLKNVQHEMLHHVYPNLGEGYPSFTPLEIKKAKSVFKNNAALREVEKQNNVPLWYLDDADELVPNSFDLANDLGIQKFQQYPGKESFKNMLDSYSGGKKFIRDALKLDNNRDYKRAWDMLSGVRLGVVPAVAGAAALQQKKEGGMITDPMGQWAHPGKNTRIPGNNITMQGVPYPVLAKASNGMTTMMYPEQHYSFPGASHVDEYPMKGWLNRYQDGGTEYTVKPGDNLTRIGRRFGMTPQQIGAANNIQDLNKIRTNQMLNIPGAAQQPIASPVAVEPSYSVPQMQQPFVPQQKVFTQPINAQPTISSSPNLSDSEASIISNYVNPSTLDSDEDKVKRQKAQKLVELARQHIADNKYFDVPADVAEASRRQGQEPAGCIGGSCELAKEAGILPKVYWSNTAFAKDAASLGYPNKGLGLKGIQNLESGDFMVYQLKESGSKDKEGKNKFIPSHLQTFLGVNPETKQYEFFDNHNKRLMTYPESEVKDRLKNTKNSYDYGAVIYKNNPFHPNKNSYMDETPTETANKDLRIDKQLKTPSNYKYSIRSDAKDYNDSTKKIMDTFVNYANDDTKINDLVSKLSTDKEEIHDSLLNVFGELGQENNWSNTGKGVKSKLENAAEKVLTFFGGGKSYSVGPGQNKFKYIPKDLKEKFGIKSTKDLYDIEKVIPLMVAQDIRNKRVLRYWGQKNLLSNKLIGHTDQDNPLTADDLKGGVGRWSPYLRNEFGLISNEKRLVNNDDLIPFNTETVSNYDPETGMFMHPRTLGKGSYPDKVAHKWDDNLQRLMINSQQTLENAEVQPNVVMFSKAAKKKSVRAFGGETNWLDRYK